MSLHTVLMPLYQREWKSVEIEEDFEEDWSMITHSSTSSLALKSNLPTTYTPSLLLPWLPNPSHRVRQPTCLLTTCQRCQKSPLPPIPRQASSSLRDVLQCVPRVPSSSSIPLTRENKASSYKLSKLTWRTLKNSLTLP